MGERLVEVPQVLMEERLVENPQIQVVEVLKQDLQPVIKEVIKEVPRYQVQYVEKVVEVSSQLQQEPMQFAQQQLLLQQQQFAMQQQQQQQTRSIASMPPVGSTGCLQELVARQAR